MDIRLDDVSGPEIAALFQEHLRDMHRVSPPDSVHALDLAGLRTPDIQSEGTTLVGTAQMGEAIVGEMARLAGKTN